MVPLPRTDRVCHTTQGAAIACWVVLVGFIGLGVLMDPYWPYLPGLIMVAVATGLMTMVATTTWWASRILADAQLRADLTQGVEQYRRQYGGDW